MTQALLVPKPKVLPQLSLDKIHSYIIVETIADGECSRIFKALHEITKEVVAIKVISKDHIHSTEDREKYEAYVNSVKSIEDPNVIQVIDFFWDNQFYFIVLPYYEFSDLRKVILDSGALPEAIACRLFQQIVSGVKAGHDKGIAHKDLTLGRILMKDSESIVLTGFQFSRSQKYSPFYSAPEMLCGIIHDPKMADAWSLGVILYILVAGHNPFEDKNLTTMKNRILMGSYSPPKGVSSACRDLISRLLVIKPQARINVDQILQHPWIFGSEEDNKREREDREESSFFQSVMIERQMSQKGSQSPSVAMSKTASVCRPTCVNGKKIRPVSRSPRPVVLRLQKVNRI